MRTDRGSGADLGTPTQEGRRVARATGLLGILTAASRILGLARDMGQAAVLDTGLAADAFTIAFIIIFTAIFTLILHARPSARRQR